MKCLIKYIIIFSKILKLNFHEYFSTAIIKKSTYKLNSKKIINRYRSSLKSPYFYSLNQNSVSLFSLNTSKLFYTIININPSFFQKYFWFHNITPNFDISILKKKVNFLRQNLNYLLNNHLKTSLKSFHSDFRLHLKSYNYNIKQINNYIKDNSFKAINNNYNMLLSSVVETPQSTIHTKSSFYLRYVIFFKLNRRLTRMFFFRTVKKNKKKNH